ncbi:MAG: helix-turn-helix domain-containing protein [Opitutales bacterium]|jgi:DNA-binding HxlR family transcriptional regulator|nr:helix-turn-helix domain-containing protein [Opitutales bacterium]|tara:strand:+ start:159 stop:572 length:414 start_codon:yes stop_codon:yes gene_type:complete
MAIKSKSTVWEGCPIRFGMGIFGDKWTLLIVRDMMFKGKRYYGEFTDPEEGISTNILADRLGKLVSNGVAEKERDPDNQSKFIYRLTVKGKELLPMMLAMVDWAEKHDPNTEVPKEFIQKLRKDPDSLKKDILIQLG